MPSRGRLNAARDLVAANWCFSCASGRSLKAAFPIAQNEGKLADMAMQFTKREFDG